MVIKFVTIVTCYYIIIMFIMIVLFSGTAHIQCSVRNSHGMKHISYLKKGQSVNEINDKFLFS